MSYQCEVFPLFSSPVCSMIIEENLEEYFDQLKKCDFEETGLVYANKTFMSENLQILEDYVELKTIIMKYFNLFKDDILHYKNTEFVITTSWMTKCYKNSYSQLHNHRNSYFSGVLYFEDYFPDSTISFEDLSIKNNIEIRSEYKNIFNAEEWSLSAQKNKILFFPSYLYHRIDPHKSEKNRYSLAFNLYPKGIIGVLDSSINIDIK